jgi:RNA polymerase sigma-32 factor
MTSELALPGMTGLVPVGSLQAYIQAVRAIPFLSQEEENRLAQQFISDNDLTAAKALVLSHLRFVVRIARGYDGYGLNQADLIQEGNMGLMKAVKRFDPGFGVRLASFAVHWIRAEIHEFILRNWRIVKIATTKAQRKLFFNLRRARTHLGWLRPEEAHGMAEDLGVPLREVYAMEQRLAQQDLGFDTPGSATDGGDTTPVSGLLPDQRFDPARLLEDENSTESAGAALEEALAALDPRSRLIVQRRWLDENKATLHELAAELGVSAERVRQVEGRALLRLKDLLQVSRPG